MIKMLTTVIFFRWQQNSANDIYIRSHTYLLTKALSLSLWSYLDALSLSLMDYNLMDYLSMLMSGTLKFKSPNRELPLKQNFISLYWDFYKVTDKEQSVSPST